MSEGRAVMRKTCLAVIVIAIGVLLMLPLLGLNLFAHVPASFFECPPHTKYVVHVQFSWFVFLFLAFGPLVLLFFITKSFFTRISFRWPKATRRLSWYGRCGLVLIAIGWLLAWTRSPYFSAIQLHTFLPLWIGYILLMNGLSEVYGGMAPLRRYGGRYLLLFPLSACFWWVFEYLNRFVQNWNYQNVEVFSAAEYSVLASLSFSTVLPAMLATADWIGGFIIIEGPATQGLTETRAQGRLRWSCLTAAVLSLLLLGVYPNFLFPMVWLAPLLLLYSVMSFFAVTGFFTKAESGDWADLVSWALAALFCGFFWELWNYYSLAKWVYQIPFVSVLHLFEMPLLGYYGYLPFGIFCGAVLWLLGFYPASGNRASD
jgi:hypothetical protein